MDLKNQLEILTNKLSYYNNESNKQLILKKNYSTQFETDNKYLPIVYYGQLVDYQFLTLTFDPDKFGCFNMKEDEQNYIFYTLSKAIKDRKITQLTGCFEYQKKTGTTHAHLIIKTDETPKEIEDYFRPYFTNNPKNKYAIKSYPAQFPKVEDYLKKESQEFYRYDLVNGITDGIESPDDVNNLQPSAPPIRSDELIQILEQYKKEQAILYINFEKKMELRYSNTVK